MGVSVTNRGALLGDMHDNETTEKSFPRYHFLKLLCF